MTLLPSALLAFQHSRLVQQLLDLCEEHPHVHAVIRAWCPCTLKGILTCLPSSKYLPQAKRGMQSAGLKLHGVREAGERHPREGGGVKQVIFSCYVFQGGMCAVICHPFRPARRKVENPRNIRNSRRKTGFLPP